MMTKKNVSSKCSKNQQEFKSEDLGIDVNINDLMPPMDIAQKEQENILTQKEYMKETRKQMNLNEKNKKNMKERRKKIRLYNSCQLLIMNIKEKRYDWTENGIESKKKSIEKLCELLNVEIDLESNGSLIYSTSFMNHIDTNNNKLQDSFDLEQLDIFQNVCAVDELENNNTQTWLSGNNPYK